MSAVFPLSQMSQVEIGAPAVCMKGLRSLQKRHFRGVDRAIWQATISAAGLCFLSD
jgi:hypothetical protein